MTYDPRRRDRARTLADLDVERRLLPWRSAGALLSPELSLPPNASAEAVWTCTFQHRTLTDLIITRLVPACLLEAERQGMEARGFLVASVKGPVAQQRPLRGFPQRPLQAASSEEVKDAICAVFAEFRDFTILARQPKSLDAAWHKADHIAEWLAKKAPEALPDFFEEVGEVFLREGALEQATRVFHRARGAERAHNLDVEEGARVWSYLRFSLGGALSVQDLEQYATSLERGSSPEVAYGCFRRLCLYRTLGGLAPWGGMLELLRRLAHRASLLTKIEERKFLKEIIQAASLVRAPIEFWRSARAELIKLAQEDPEVRGSLLHLMPGYGQDSGYFSSWVALLGASGASEALIQSPRRIPSEARPPSELRAWWDRFLQHITMRWSGVRVSGAVLDLFRRSAPRLCAEGLPLSLARRGTVDLDLIDIALEMGVPLERPHADASCDLVAWIRAEKGTQRAPRELHFLTQEPAFSFLIVRALEDASGHPGFEASASQYPALFPLRSAWFLEKVRDVRRADLRTGLKKLQALQNRLLPEHLSLFPELRGAMERLDPLRALHKAVHRVHPDLKVLKASEVGALLHLCEAQEAWGDKFVALMGRELDEEVVQHCLELCLVASQFKNLQAQILSVPLPRADLPAPKKPKKDRLGRVSAATLDDLESPLERFNRFYYHGAYRPLMLDPSIPEWRFFGLIGALAFQAQAPWTPPKRREKVLRDLMLWARAPFSTARPRARLLRGVFPQRSSPLFAQVVGPHHQGTWGIERGTSRYIVRTWEESGPGVECLVLEKSQGGSFSDPPGMDIVWERGPGWDGAHRIHKLSALIRRRGPAPWLKEVSRLIAAETGLTEPEAALLWNAVPHLRGLNLEGDTHLKRIGGALGMDPTEVVAASVALQDRASWERCLQLWEGTMALRPEEMWEPTKVFEGESAAERFVRAWGKSS